MIYKRCTRCGNRLEYNSECSCLTKHKINSDDYKSNIEKRFYKSKEWQSLTNIIKNRFNYIDIYSYYILNKIENGQVVHHIVPINEDFSRRYQVSNLIYLTEKNHRLIHNTMRKSIEDKEKIQNILFSLIRKFDIDFIG